MLKKQSGVAKKQTMVAERSLARQYARAFLRIVQGLIEVAVHWMFGAVYGSRGKRMPPIRDLVLLDSATTIAFKIRTGKVSRVKSEGNRESDGWKAVLDC